MANKVIKVKRGTSFNEWSQIEGNIHGKVLMGEWNRARTIIELHTNSYHVSYGSTKKVWWTCKNCGRDYLESVVKRVHSNAGCPYCKRKGGTSAPEQGLYDIFKALYPKTVHRDKHLGFEIDIYIPELMMGIEYNGSYYHKKLHDKSERDRMKVVKCKENGIKLIQVWDDGETTTPILNTDELTIKYKYKQNIMHNQLFEISTLIINEIIQGYKPITDETEGNDNSNLTAGMKNVL